jgi:predicted RecA/RadA family phage recombinase
VAKNQVYADGNQFPVAVTNPVSPVSGDPVVVGQLPGVALTDKDAITGLTLIKTNGVHLFAVKGENPAGGAVAVAAGDIVYYDAAAAVKLNMDNTNGVRFGYALDAVSSGATATIRVKVGYR